MKYIIVLINLNYLSIIPEVSQITTKLFVNVHSATIRSSYNLDSCS